MRASECVSASFASFIDFIGFFFYFKEITGHMKDEIIKEESCRSITPSLNMCDMDERDWTSLESSSESIAECSGDEEMMVSPKTT